MAKSPTVDAVMAAERAASFTKRSIKKGAKEAGLLLALSMLDLTTLEGKDSPEKVRALCRKAVLPDPNRPELPSVAAVCVYPSLVSVARETLGESGVKVASVATGFPSGQYPIQVRLEDVKRAVHAGAHEIDMVINRGAYLAGRFDEVCDEVRAVKRACMTPPRGVAAKEFHPAHIKVILETGELETLDDVRRASDMAIRAMADVDDEYAAQGVSFAHAPVDFIKTSTGKVQPAATMPVTLVMLEAIRDWYVRTGRKVGMKPAGGIRTSKQALHYLVMVRETLGFLEGGEAWLTPEYFRFGASTLCNDILRQLEWLRRGVYMAGYDFSES